MTAKPDPTKSCFLARRKDGKLTSTRQTANGLWLCTSCQRTLPESEFYPKKRNADGQVTRRCPKCRVCEAEKSRAYRAAHPDIIRAHEKRRGERHGQRRNQEVRIDRLRNPGKYRKADQEDYLLEREVRLQQERERFQRDRDLIIGQKRLRSTLSSAQQDYPDGFMLVLIEDRVDFRACPTSAMRPRAHEYALAETWPHPDGHGWKMRSWSIVDARHRVWVEKSHRWLTRQRRQEMIAAGLPPENIVAAIGALR